ncbi:uncharacterized protein LOC126739862 isoform X2 [Anthonomus grandis grandis]|uniref:uncharacterized protein LOC126739862 isoform X2 n=1 Tax=Anthonomus grandis grandis TaxID=2921223 RepID=UPI002165988A|nr:uncharacterized protein LOC126739862 isoform X2 [Anthonomus grandis grandis]
MSCALHLNQCYGIDGNEKWKAILDSVFEFITASKTMLYVLNERVRSDDKISEGELQRLIDEEVRLANYRASLHICQSDSPDQEPKPKFIYTETVDNSSTPAPEIHKIGDDLEHLAEEPFITSNSPQCIQKHENKTENADHGLENLVEQCPSGHLISTICISEIRASLIKLDDEENALTPNSYDALNRTKPNLLKSSVEIQSDFSDQMKSIEIPSIDDEEKLRLIECQEKSTSSLTESGNNPMFCRHGKLISQKCHYPNKSDPVVQPTKETIKQENKSEVLSQNSTKQTCKVQCRSRIPRSKNFEQRLTDIEKHPYEGSNIGKKICKNCQKNTYSSLRLKSGAQKGDNI